MKVKAFIILMTLIVVIGCGTALYSKMKGLTPNPPTTEPTEAAQAQSTEQKIQGPENQATTAAEDNLVKSPDFTVVDAEGNSVNLSDMIGTPIVLNFWASWCPPCKSEMPEFNKVCEELGDKVRFVMVDAVDGSRETKEKGAAYIAQEGFTFPVYYDIEQSAVTEYGIRAFPTSFFIDSDGYIVDGVEGAIEEASLRSRIDKILD